MPTCIRRHGEWDGDQQAHPSQDVEHEEQAAAGARFINVLSHCRRVGVQHASSCGLVTQLC